LRGTLSCTLVNAPLTPPILLFCSLFCFCIVTRSVPALSCCRHDGAIPGAVGCRLALDAGFSMGKGTVLLSSTGPLGYRANTGIKVLGAFLLATIVLGVLYLLYLIWCRLVRVWTVSCLVHQRRKKHDPGCDAENPFPLDSTSASRCAQVRCAIHRSPSQQ
jgi:hypothetical protein